jgi:hypothetical protein
MTGCQFGTSVILTETDGIKWCQFHAPCVDLGNQPTAKGNWNDQEVQAFNDHIAKLISERIPDGTPVDLCGVIFPSVFAISPHVRSTSAMTYPPAKLPGILFQRCRFHAGLVLDDVYCTSFLDCRDSLFNNNVSLAGRFQGRVTFEGAEFSAGLSLNGCRFEERLDCSAREGEKGPPQFAVQTPGKNIPWFQFINNLCESTVSFSGRRIANATTIKGTVFLKTPNFVNTDLYSGIDFESCYFPPQLQDVVWAAPNDKKWKWEESIYDGARVTVSTAPGDASLYRALRLAMEQHRNRHQEGTFYIWEQRSLASNTRAPKWFRLTSRIYDWTTRYGTNPFRPLLQIATSLFFFGVTYALMASPVIDFQKPVDWGLIFNAFAFALQQLVSPFRVWQLTAVPGWACTGLLSLQLVATLESLIGLSLFGLFFLALRWTFQRG